MRRTAGLRFVCKFWHVLGVFLVCLLAALSSMITAVSAEQQTDQIRNLQEQLTKSNSATTQAINAVLNEQIKAWNAGDIEGFMAYYWKSDDLTFSSGGKTTRSWKSTLERYKQRYPDKAAMGTTTFRNLEITPLNDSAAMVLGEWQLKRESGETMGGNFTLVLRKIEGRWLIIHDHTSQVPAP